jgi:hypothetical protein
MYKQGKLPPSGRQKSQQIQVSEKDAPLNAVVRSLGRNGTHYLNQINSEQFLRLFSIWSLAYHAIEEWKPINHECKHALEMRKFW